jgi:hypothetical protein
VHQREDVLGGEEAPAVLAVVEVGIEDREVVGLGGDRRGWVPDDEPAYDLDCQLALAREGRRDAVADRRASELPPMS